MQGERERRPMGGVDEYTDGILPYGLSLRCETSLKRLLLKTLGYGCRYIRIPVRNPVYRSASTGEYAEQKRDKKRGKTDGQWQTEVTRY